MKKITPSLVLLLTGLTLSSCASLLPKSELKAPCGPTAGLVDPCGNRVPINSFELIDDDQMYLKYEINIVEV